MGRKNRKLPPASRVPQNLTGLAYYEVESVHVSSYTPLPDGKGLCTELHVSIHMKGGAPPLILRMKTPESVDLLIAALVRHRNDVWPGHIPDQSLLKGE